MDQQQTTSYAHRGKFLQLTGTSDAFRSCVILWQDQCYSARFHCWITETFGLPLFESGSTAGTQGDGADDGEDAADDDDDEQQQHLQSGVRSIYMTVALTTKSWDHASGHIWRQLVSTSKQEALLQQTDRATRYVSRNRANCCTTVKPKTDWNKKLEHHSLETIQNESVPKIIINHTINYFLKLQSAFW